MKNLKIYKKALALITSASILLLSGCTGGTDNKEEEQTNQLCTHLTIYFEEGPITFKECEGYTIDAWDSMKGGELHYDITKEGKVLFSESVTNEYNIYEVHHDNVDEIIEHSSVQKSK